MGNGDEDDTYHMSDVCLSASSSWPIFFNNHAYDALAHSSAFGGSERVLTESPSAFWERCNDGGRMGDEGGRASYREKLCVNKERASEGEECATAAARCRFVWIAW